MLLHGHANGFLVVNMLPKLHTNDLFGWASSPCKTSLVLILMMKHFFMELKLFLKYLAPNMTVSYIMSTLLSPGSKYDCVSGLLGCSCGPIKHRRFRLVRVCNKEAIPGSHQAKRLSFSLATKCQILLDAPFSCR